MKKIYDVLKRSLFVLRESWLAPRAKKNLRISDELRRAGEILYNNKLGFDKYFEDNKPIGKIIKVNGWKYNDKLDEYTLKFKNSIFSNGTIKIRNNSDKDILIFLPGYYSSSDDILINKNHPQFLSDDCKKNELSIATWDFPLQGRRGDQSLYLNLKSVVSIEREYSRFLHILNTSLWLEILNEINFCIEEIYQFYGKNINIHLVGWSMGGAFSPHISNSNSNIKSCISAGSLARYKDLLTEGNTRLHGYFFYPNNVLNYFDLEDVLISISEKKINHMIIYGANDPGCLKYSQRFIQNLIESGILLQKNFKKLDNSGHFFNPMLKQKIFNSINQWKK